MGWDGDGTRKGGDGTGQDEYHSVNIVLNLLSCWDSSTIKGKTQLLLRVSSFSQWVHFQVIHRKQCYHFHF